MRVQLAAVSDADAALETVAAATAAVARSMPDPWRCELCAIAETPFRRPGPSGEESLCNGAFVLSCKGVRLDRAGGEVHGGVIVGLCLQLG